MSNDNYLLDLSTERLDRQHIKIDDVVYDMAVPEDFELGEFLELASAGQAAASLIGAAKEDRTPKKTAELMELMDLVVKSAILGLPDDIFDKLKIVQKFQVVSIFSDAITGKLGGPKSQEQKEQEAPESPGPKSSQDSPDSTEEPPTTGSEPT